MGICQPIPRKRHLRKRKWEKNGKRIHKAPLSNRSTVTSDYLGLGSGSRRHVSGNDMRVMRVMRGNPPPCVDEDVVARLVHVAPREGFDGWANSREGGCFSTAFLCNLGCTTSSS